MPLTLPCLSNDRFCSVIPMAAARSLDLTLRRASITSSSITMGISISNKSAVFRIHFAGLPQDTRDYCDTGSEKQRDEARRGQTQGEKSLAQRLVHRDPKAQQRLAKKSSSTHNATARPTLPRCCAAALEKYSPRA